MLRYDVVVVGAGPAGASAAQAAAERGARTLLVDRRSEIGHPVQCGEFLPAPHELADLFDAADLIRRAYRIPAETILRETRWMVCVSPSGRRFRFPLAGVMVSRRAFDKALAHAAEGAGAELWFPRGVASVKDDTVTFADGQRVGAETIVAADGPTSTVARSVGYHLPRTLYRMITATAEGPLSDAIELHFGRIAPGGYAWVFPRAEDLNVGLGVTAVRGGEGLDRLLDRFVAGCGLSPVRERTRWWVPIGPPPAAWSVGRVLFVGDAANLVMATNGGGIPTALLSGWRAGEVAADHVRHGLPREEYDRSMRAALSPPLDRGFRIKRATDRVTWSNTALALGMRYIGAQGLDAVMRLRWPARLGGGA
ncbi:MAG: geranylgeranyl reductase family protein [Thermoplasmata archaeon]